MSGVEVKSVLGAPFTCVGGAVAEGAWPGRPTIIDSAPPGGSPPLGEEHDDRWPSAGADLAGSCWSLGRHQVVSSTAISSIALDASTMTMIMMSLLVSLSASVRDQEARGSFVETPPARTGAEPVRHAGMLERLVRLVHAHGHAAHRIGDLLAQC